MMNGGPLGLAVLNEREAFANLLESLKIAENACRQLALHTERKEWLAVGTLLSGVRFQTTALATSSLRR